MYQGNSSGTPDVLPLHPRTVSFPRRRESRSAFSFLLFSFLILSSSHASALTSVSTSDTALVKNGLVGHWTFDGKNMTNATATDISGGGNNGTLKNMTTAGSAIPGKIGQALKFNGVNNYITLGPHTSEVSVYSISLWVYNYGSTTGAVLIQGNGTSYCFYNPRIYMVSGTIGVAESGCSGAGSIGTKALSKGWHHSVITRNGQNAIFYVDGVVISTDNSNNGGTPTEGLFMIGANPNNPSGSTVTSYFDGAIDDVRVYNRAISASEVQSLYKAGGGVVQSSTANTKANTNGTGISSGLVGHWTFDGKNMSTTTIRDISGSGYNGTLTNIAATTSRVPGKVGQALSLDGVNDEVTIAGAALGSTALTVSSWVYVKSFSETTFNDNPLEQGAVIFNTRNTVSERSPTLLISPKSGGAGIQQAVVFSFDTSAIALGAKGATAIQTGRWYHVVGTFDNSGVATYGGNWNVYVNGVKDNSSVNNFFLAGSYSSFTGSTWTIGNAPRWPDPANALETSNIIVDDTRVYNRALSAKEILALYKSGQVAVGVSPVANVSSGGTGINSGLVGYWTFDGKNMTNATATDSSGNGNNGTRVNGPTATIGKIGQGIKLDGVDDYVAVSGSPTVKNISYWVKPSSGNYLINLGSSSPMGTKGYVLNNGLYSGSGGSTRYLNGALATAEILGSELLTNPGAESGTMSGWTSYYNGASGASASVSAVAAPYTGSYSFQTYIATYGTNPYDIQFWNDTAPFSTTLGALYKVTFTTIGNTSFTGLVAKVFQNPGPNTSASPAYTFDVTTSWQTHTFYFYSERSGTSDNRIDFLMGTPGNVGYLYFDDISVKQVTSVGDVRNNTWNFVSINLTNSVSTGAIKIGEIESRYFGGTVDDVRFYNRALSPTEVKSLYKLGTQ